MGKYTYDHKSNSPQTGRRLSARRDCMRIIMPERKLTRLQGYDYSQKGYYFVTVCTHGRIEWLGKIENGIMVLNEYGNIVLGCWHDLPNHYRNVALDEFAIMPNHAHGIIVIENNVGNGLKPFPTQPENGRAHHGLSEIMRGFKTFSSRKINETINNDIKFQWQKSFYDKIVRDDKSLDDIRQYIVGNPLKWEFDRENPSVSRIINPLRQRKGHKMEKGLMGQ